MADYLDYFIQWDCPDCDAENFEGVNRTFLEHNGLPVIMWDDSACQSWTCSGCAKEFYTSDMDLMSDD